MKQKILASLLLVGCLLGMLVQPVAAKSYLAERFDVLIEIQADGSYLVTETVVFRFSGGDFTYAFREVLWNEVDEIRFVDAEMDGTLLPLGTQPGQIEISQQRPLGVKWHFAPARDVSRTFTMRYRVVGNLRPTAEGDTLYWQAIPQEHEYSIQAAQIRVVFPATFMAQNLQIDGASGTPAVSSEAGQVTWQVGSVDEDEAVVVRMSLPAGSLLQQPPAWLAEETRRKDEIKQTIPLAGGLGLGLLALGGVGLGLLSKRSRMSRSASIPLGVVTNPPDDLTPAEVGFLISNGKAEFQLMMATLFDLARRGWLTIEQEEHRLWGRNVKDFKVIRKTEGEGELQAHEKRLLSLGFETNGQVQNELFFTVLMRNLTGGFRVFKQEVEQLTFARDLYVPGRAKERSRISTVSSILVFIALSLGCLSIFGFSKIGMTSFWLILAAVLGAISILGVGVMILSGNWDVLTQEGQQRKERWSAFSKYLKDVIREQRTLQPQWLELYLPFAMVFKKADEFMKAYQKQGMPTRLSWLQMLPGEDDSGIAFVSGASSYGSGGDGDGGGGGGGGGGGSSGAG